MSRYRRVYEKGGCYFFTLVTYQRKKILTDTNNINHLRRAFKMVMETHPYEIEAIVILPDHLHCIWNLPEGDEDFSTRWRLIKRYFSQHVPIQKNNRGEKLIWQRRFWEHRIRNEKDWKKHMDYIHYNPVKHGYVQSVKEWEYSSFKACVEKGYYYLSWGSGNQPSTIVGMGFE